MRSDNISRAPFNTVTSLHLKLADDAQVREFSDKDSVYSVGSISRNRRANKIKNPSMKSIKGITKNKNKNMDYTNYAYNEAVGRLKFMLAESYTTPKTNYLKSSIYEDPTDNFSDSVSAIDRPVLSDISKYLSPNQKARLGVYRPKKLFPTFSASKENLVAEPAQTQTYTAGSSVDYYSTARTLPPPAPVTSAMPAPVEIFDFIEKQEDYIQQLEKESKFCRNELSNLLEKVKDVINENEALTETARSELAALTGYEGDKKRVVVTTTTSSESEDIQAKKSPIRKKDTLRSPRYANAPKIVYEARISELEAELMQSNIDLKRLKQENAELQRKLALADPVTTLTATTSCEAHRKQIEQLQMEKSRLEDSLRHSQKALDEAKAEQMSGLSSKRYVNDLMQMECSQAELEVKHLRDELDRQHERVRELQHEMARRIADERSNAERRYNNQVDQLGGDLSNQWEQVAKLQMELERQKRYESDMKRDLSSRNAQIEDLKQELRANRSAMLADMAQINAEKQSLEQEITSLRLQLDRAAREHKTEAARLNAEISSLRQRLDRGDADLLHSKREVLRLNDEIANLEKELAYGELKNEVRPTKKDLDQRISEMQTKHAETVNELEDMIQSQRQLMDKLTQECKTLTKNLEETTIKHKTEISALQSNVEYLTNRMINNDNLNKLENTSTSYATISSLKAPLDYKSTTFGTTEASRAVLDDYANAKTSSPYNYETVRGKSSDTIDPYVSTTAITTTTPTAKYEHSNGSYDDENLKDLSEGEKQRETQSLAQTTVPDESNTEYTALEPQAQHDTNLATADYTTADYAGYEGYEHQQQYDPNAYGGVYDGTEQYDDTQIYDANAELAAADNYENYTTNSAEYAPTTSSYQYDTPSTTVESVAAIKSATKQANSGSANSAPSGRSQPRTSSSNLGSAGAGGTVSSGKSFMPQQSASSASKK